MKSYSGIKSILLIFMLMAVAIEVNGQAHFGFRAGVNANKIFYDQETYKKFYDTGVGLGYTGGVVFLYENKEKYGFYTEILYSSKSKKIDSDANDFDTHLAEYTYLDVPLMFRIKFHNPKFDWFLMLGPELNYWLGGKGSFRVFDASRGEHADYDYSVNFGEIETTSDYLNVMEANRLQLSFSIGAGLIWNLKNANFISFDARFSLGNTYIGGYEAASIPNIGLVDNLEYTNNVLALSAVYYFNILDKMRLMKNKYR